MSRARRMKPPTRKRLGRVAVEGRSMLPTYGQGDWLIVRWGGRVRVGDVVVAVRGDRTEIIKRVTAAHDQGWWLEGDNPAESIDSRSLGPFAPHQIKGRVLFRYRRANKG